MDVQSIYNSNAALHGKNHFDRQKNILPVVRFGQTIWLSDRTSHPRGNGGGLLLYWAVTTVQTKVVVLVCLDIV